jgi:uncharacterized protein with PIN domain
MIVDTPALIAILRDEPEAASCAHAIENSVVRRVLAANFVEAAITIDASRDPIASRRFDDLMKEAQVIELHGTPIATSAKPVAILPAEFRRLLCLCARQVHR